MAPVKRNLTSELVPLIGPSVGDSEKPLPQVMPLVFGLKMAPTGGDLTTEPILAKFERLVAPKMTSYLDFVLGPKGKLYALAKDRIDIFLPVAEIGLRKYDVSLILPVAHTPASNSKGYEWPMKIQVDDHGSIYVSLYPNGGKCFDVVIHDGNRVLLFADGKLGENDFSSGLPEQSAIAVPRGFGQNIAYSRAKKLTVFPTADRMSLRVLSGSGSGSGTGVEPRNIEAPFASVFDFDGTLDQQNAGVVWYSNTGSKISGSGLFGENLFEPIPAPYLSTLRVSYSGDVFVLTKGTIASLKESPEVDPLSGLLVVKVAPVETPVVETPVVETPVVEEVQISVEVENLAEVEIEKIQEPEEVLTEISEPGEIIPRTKLEPVVLVSETDPGFGLPSEPVEILPLDVVPVSREPENSAPKNLTREDEVEIDE